MKLNSKEIIDYLNLTPHPEGGYFKETYRSKQSIINSELWEGAKVEIILLEYISCWKISNFQHFIK